MLLLRRYNREHRNALLCGPMGVGKTHVAQALGQEACRQSFRVLFINTNKMPQHLNGGRADDGEVLRLDGLVGFAEEHYAHW